jgi:outer membrane protein assembly factor BamB
MPKLLVLVLLSPAVYGQTWNQWGGNAQHTASLAVAGQPFRAQLADIVYDPFVALEIAESRSLLVHYQTPLSDGDDVFMMAKQGTYTGFGSWDTQTWVMRKHQWVAGELVTRWTTASDWDPVPAGSPRFEPVFHGALANGFVYVPGAGGTILELDRATGVIRRRLGMFAASLDPTVYVTSPITVADDGTLFYNTLKLRDTDPWANDHLGAWLVKITPDGTATRASYASFVPNGPAAHSECMDEFRTAGTKPPSPTAVAPSVICGSQRAGINVAPAIGLDGTIYTASRTHLAPRWGWLVAVNPDLTPRWASSFRNLFHDGCNILLPPNGMTGGCREGTTTGFDPSDNQPGSGVVNDNSTASPVVAPDGTIYYGTYTQYNFRQGHMTRFSATGQFLSAYPFGWDVTPAIWRHDNTFSIVTKENRYGLGTRPAGDEESYYITQLSPDLGVEWRFKSTETRSCERRPDGSLDCVDDHPRGFEWCVNALAVDVRGVVYVNSEDGHLYAINQGGTLRERIFLQLATGAAYTPLSLGSTGRIYTQNAGHLFVVGAEKERRRAVRK